jgi:LPS sulfotransferase NodH
MIAPIPLRPMELGALSQLPPADWSPPKKICFIATMPRCGSNLLASAMNETHGLGYPREFFNEAVTLERHPLRRPTAELQARHAREDGTSANGVMSIKLHLLQVRRAARYLQFDRWFPRIHWVWIRREDILAQAISYEIAMQSGAWMSRQAEDREPVYSTSAIDRRIAEIQSGEAAWQTYFRLNRIVPLVLWYEDIASDPKKTAGMVAEFIEGPLGDLTKERQRPNYFSGISIQRGERNEEWRRRFEAERGCQSARRRAARRR